MVKYNIANKRSMMTHQTWLNAINVRMVIIPPPMLVNLEIK